MEKPQNVFEQVSNILNNDTQKYQGIEVGKTVSNLIQNQKLNLNSILFVLNQCY